MNKIHIIGTGCCGFLRAYDMFKNYIPIVYKGGKRKFQNGFEIWDHSSGLIWNSEDLPEEERMRRASMEGGISNITHSYLPYVTEFISIDPSVKFLCLKGRRDHSIRSLLTSWGYRNPCYVKDRSLGVGRNRYPVDQFPDYSFCGNELEATTKYWDTYYQKAEDLQKKYPDNFIIVDSVDFFSNEEYQNSIKEFLNVRIPFYNSPVDLDSFKISTTLHGGLGNNLFQMAEVISFCSKYNLPDPFFGTWNLLNNEKFPPFYNADRLLGGHEGSHEEIKNLFPNLDWRGDLEADFDVKFVINDMFRFGDITNLDSILEKLHFKIEKKLNFASLHFRFCTRPADDHVNGIVRDDFYQRVFDSLPKNVEILVFSDDEGKAAEKIHQFKNRFDRNFTLMGGNAFRNLKDMASCEYHILHVSTFSFWGSFLGSENPILEGSKVYYPSAFVAGHGDKMISPILNWNLM